MLLGFLLYPVYALDTRSTSVFIETEQSITYLKIIVFSLIDAFRITVLGTENLWELYK